MMITAGGLLAIGEGDDVVGLRELQRSMVALYVGGMGAKGKNFYNELAVRYGYEKEAAIIQDLYLSGEKQRGRGRGAGGVPRADDALRSRGLRAGPRRRLQGGGRDAPSGAPDPQSGQSAASLIGALKEML